MSRISAYILFLSLSLLAACDSAKKDFETLKEDEIILDINTEEYSLNGNVIGKTATDISAFDDIFGGLLDDNPLHNKLCDSRATFQEEALRRGEPADGFDFAKLHVDGNLSYGDFYKAFSSMFFCGYSVFDIAIGSNYKDVFQLSLPTVDYMWCGFVIQQMKGLRYKYLRNRQRLSLDEMSEIDVKDRECVEDHETLDLLLSFYRKDDGIAYVVSLNEAYFNKGSRFDGYNFYTFNDENDLWMFIEDVRSRVERQTEKKPETKQDRVLRLLIDALDGPNKITLVFEKDVLMKDIAPIIKKLNTYGYRFAFDLD
ncbi:hypothetical protein [Fibrobacter succinogenes]|uniref:Lipoprotein n=1 Tax=Fibrobacter succinogenes TaxID=833 RepID=A0A380S7R5_FIBSU|nr:hypothetical protein [Fibrobacter succinogenes]PWJ34090.1 hypothetical protein IE02_2678 [Fibrobacter succinogenes subsp. elongatus]SUQ25879.1 hypothetical protein SAMN05661053_2678 [Fibrobacter succinogenes]